MPDSGSKTNPPQAPVSGDAPTLPGGSADPTLPLPAGTKPGAPSQASVLPGMFLGPYALIEMLGRGGMGTVWKARHTKLDKLVALKLLPPHLMTDGEAVSRFEREMKAVGRLEHPHIVRAMDAGQTDGVHYLVMEYIEGTDLSRLVKNRGPRSVAEACQMIRHAALGLAHAHEHGLVHRDIKPSNLLLSKKGLVKILDLGLARLQSERAADEASLTMQGETMGTPDYMAPEQWQSAHTAGPSVDLYALGCTLYHLLTGHPPFSDKEHSSYGQKMKAHLLDTPPLLRAARDDVPPEVEALCQSLLAKDPAQRPASAKKLAVDIRAILKGGARSRAITETIAWPEAASGLKRVTARSGTMMAAAAVVALLAVITAAVFSLPRREPALSHDRGSEPPTVPTESPTKLAPAIAISPFNAAQAKDRQEAWANYLGVPLEYTNALGMKFRLIPPGEYERGVATDRIEDAARKIAKAKPPGMAEILSIIRSEAPAHRVRIDKPFYLSAYEVTQGQFARVMGYNPSHFSATGGGHDKVGKLDRDRLPVESVTFENAVEFCRRLISVSKDTAESPAVSINAGVGYRLPSDAEWEYACRAGTTDWFVSGGSESEFGKYSRNQSNFPIAVGSLQSNAFGLFDMHGNVWELCQDYYSPNDYASLGAGPVVSPTGPPTGRERVIRGGSFNLPHYLCRSASRAGIDEARMSVGFRPALSVEFVRSVLSARRAEK